MEEIGAKIKESVDALGDSIIATLGSWMDRAQSAVMDKGGELLGGISGGISNSIGSAKAGLSNMVSPNAIGRGKSDPTPSVEVGPSKAVAAPTPSKDIGAMLQSAGFSMDSVGGVEATDLGQTASVGVDGVGCASYDAPRATSVTQAQILQR